MTSRHIALGILFGVGALVLVAAAALTWALQPPMRHGPHSMGGPFTMVDTEGRLVTERDLLGKPTAIAFGFTFCPEVCPTTLLALTQAMKRMGPDADKLNVVFVTIDPGRDTPEQLKLYLSSFDRRIRGFTGTPAEVAAMTKAYHVYYRRVPTEGGGYTMDHTAGVFLFDAGGAIAGELPYEEDQDTSLAKLTTLVAPQACLPRAPPPVDLWTGAQRGSVCSGAG